MNDIDQIYQEYFTDVYRYLLRLCREKNLAEEITQETFFKALKNLNHFQGDCSLYVWLCQIAKNTYYSHCRRERLWHFDRSSAAEIELEALHAEEQSIQNALVQKETAFELHKALHSMEEPYKEVFMLRTFGELSFAEIAKLFEKTESWARVTYYRAKIKIKESHDSNS